MQQHVRKAFLASKHRSSDYNTDRGSVTLFSDKYALLHHIITQQIVQNCTKKGKIQLNFLHLCPHTSYQPTSHTTHFKAVDKSV